MAQLVLGLGSSHTPMLNTRQEDWIKFEERDVRGKFLDKAGNPARYETLKAEADPALRAVVASDALDAKYDQVQRGVERLKQTLADAALDALIVVGDDQDELYHADNLPSVLIYYGDTIRNVPRHLEKPNDIAWFQDARAGYYEAAGERDYPAHAGLALHIIRHMVDAEFDVSAAQSLKPGEGEGHAFAFIHKRLMDHVVTPIVPVCLNTYYPPNQPTPRRCYRIGQAIRAAVEAYPEALRVGIIASGGLSHFVVDEDLDRGLIEAFRTRDAEALFAVDRAKLNSGSSEIRNWICVAGALEHLDMTWVDYVPGYRTEAGTGTGMCFAEWTKARA